MEIWRKERLEAEAKAGAERFEEVSKKFYSVLCILTLLTITNHYDVYIYINCRLQPFVNLQIVYKNN